MNAHVGGLLQQHARYQKIRARLFNPPARTKAAEAIIKPSVRVSPPKPKLWEIEEVQQDYHVQQYYRRLSEMGANPPKAYVKDRCNELGVSFAEVIGAGRRRKISLVRHQLMYEVSQKFGLSYPALGRLFGHRDHTSCLYAVRKIEALQATE